MLAMVDYCRSEISTGQFACPCLCIYSARDEIVDLDKMREVLGCLQTPCTTIAQLPGSPGHELPGHELAGDVLAPHMNQDLEWIVADFLNRTLSLQGANNSHTPSISSTK